MKGKNAVKYGHKTTNINATNKIPKRTKKKKNTTKQIKNLLN